MKLLIAIFQFFIKYSNYFSQILIEFHLIGLQSRHGCWFYIYLAQSMMKYLLDILFVHAGIIDLLIYFLYTWGSLTFGHTFCTQSGTLTYWYIFCTQWDHWLTDINFVHNGITDFLDVLLYTMGSLTYWYIFLYTMWSLTYLIYFCTQWDHWLTWFTFVHNGIIDLIYFFVHDRITYIELHQQHQYKLVYECCPGDTDCKTGEYFSDFWYFKLKVDPVF